MKNETERARVAFLNMIDVAPQFDIDQDEQAKPTYYRLTVGHLQLLDLVMALGIDIDPGEELVDAIDRAIDERGQ